MFEQDEDFNFDEAFLQEIINDENIESRVQNILPVHQNVNSIISNSSQLSNDNINPYEKKLTETNFLFENEKSGNSKSDIILTVDPILKRKSTNNYMAHSKKMCPEQTMNIDINRKKNYSNSILDHRPIHNILNIIKNDNDTLCENRSAKDVSLKSNLFISSSKSVNSTSTKENSNSKILNKNNIASCSKNNLQEIESVNSFNKNRCFSTMIPSKTQKRKFPGPAGLLPDCISPFLNLTEQISNCGLNNSESVITNDEINICSQSTVNLFNGQLWLQMLKDYSISKHTETVSLPKKYTIAWLKKNAIIRKLIKQKSPFLAAIVENVEHFDENHSVLLKDQTGDILGIFSDEVWNEYGKNIQYGSVIVLKQIGVLTTNFTLKRHYLNITLNNIVVIYSLPDIDSENVHQLTTECDFKMTQGLKFMCGSDLINEIKKVKSTYRSEITKYDNRLIKNDCDTSSSKSNVGNNFNFAVPKNILSNSKSLKDNETMNKLQINTNVTSYNSFVSKNSNVSISNSAITPDYVSTTPFSIKPELRSLLFNRNISNNNVNNFAMFDQSKTTNIETPIKGTSVNSSISDNSAMKSDIESILDNTLDGIDTDSLFDDF